LTGLTIAITAVAAGLLVGWLMHLVALVNQRSLINDVRNGVDVTIDEADRADGFVAVTAVLTILVAVAIFVLLIVWLWRAWGNAHVFIGASSLMSKGRGWAVGAWFIPFANFFLVPQLMAGSWRSADPVARGYAGWKGLSVTPWVWVWASVTPLLWIANSAARDPADGAPIEDFLRANAFNMASAVLGIVWAATSIGMVRSIAKRQQEQAVRLAIAPA